MLREAAEYPNSFVALGLGEERIETDRYTLCMSQGKLSNTVQRQRFEREEMDDVLAEVRSLLRARGRTRTQWEIGSAAEPDDLVALLLERGLARDSEPFAVALALRTAPPAPAESDLIVRRVQTDDEYVAAKVVQFEAFGTPAEVVAERRAHMPGRWRESPGSSTPCGSTARSSAPAPEAGRRPAWPCSAAPPSAAHAGARSTER